jgi:hypothetical protein
MEPLPTGTVTFLFTDIEGSTELVRRLGDRKQKGCPAGMILQNWVGAEVRG